MFHSNPGILILLTEEKTKTVTSFEKKNRLWGGHYNWTAVGLPGFAESYCIHRWHQYWCRCLRSAWCCPWRPLCPRSTWPAARPPRSGDTPRWRCTQTPGHGINSTGSNVADPDEYEMEITKWKLKTFPSLCKWKNRIMSYFLLGPNIRDINQTRSVK